MYYTAIINPRTRRRNNVRAWQIVPVVIMDSIKSQEYQGAKDISWDLLNQQGAVNDMEREAGGDCAASNFALAVFEHALDWRLGTAVLNTIKSCIQQYHKLPKPFSVAVNRAGDVFIISASGKVYVT